MGNNDHFAAHVYIAPSQSELFRLPQSGVQGKDQCRHVPRTTTCDHRFEASLLLRPEIPYTTIPFISVLDRPDRIAADSVAAEGKLIGLTQYGLIPVLGSWAPPRMIAEPVIDFFGFHRVGGATAQLPNDQIHPPFKGTKIPLAVILIPLLRFLPKFGDGD